MSDQPFLEDPVQRLERAPFRRSGSCRHT
jgi:hypothetical protein